MSASPTGTELVLELETAAIGALMTDVSAIGRIEQFADAIKEVTAAIRKARDIGAPWPPAERAPVQPSAERDAVIEKLDQMLASFNDSNSLALRSPPLQIGDLEVHISVVAPHRMKPSDAGATDNTDPVGELHP